MSQDTDLAVLPILYGRKAMQQQNERTTNNRNYLSSSDEYNPVDVLRPFEAHPVILVAVSVQSENKTENTAEITNNCIHAIWDGVAQSCPNCAGHRTLWNTVFFVFPEQEILHVRTLLQTILKSKECLCATTRCILFEAYSNVDNLMKIVDEMIGEANFKPYFGCDVRFIYRFINGEEWVQQV